MHGIDMNTLLSTLKRHGFEVEGPNQPTINAESLRPITGNIRTEQLKGYLKRLGKGESLDAVRADFTKEFGDVEASEIMQAEQELLAEGTPLREVQQLCDIHSALFMGQRVRNELPMQSKRWPNLLAVMKPFTPWQKPIRSARPTFLTLMVTPFKPSCAKTRL